MKQIEIIGQEPPTTHGYFEEVKFDDVDALCEAGSKFVADLKAYADKHEFQSETEHLLECPKCKGNKAILRSAPDEENFQIWFRCCDVCFELPKNDEIWNGIASSFHDMIRESEFLRAPHRNYITHFVRFFARAKIDGKETTITVI